MHADSQPFDLAELSRLIDQACVDRGMTQAALSRQVGVSSSTIRRFRTAADAEADGVLALIGWLGIPPEYLVENSTVDATPLPPSGDGQIRVDMRAVAKVTGSSAAKAVSRTTIQRLVTAAQTSGHPVASLTRRSEM